MGMSFMFNTWPEGDEVREVWFTKIQGEGIFTQATLEFSQEAALEKARALNRYIPGQASVLGPFRLRKCQD